MFSNVFTLLTLALATLSAAAPTDKPRIQYRVKVSSLDHCQDNNPVLTIETGTCYNFVDGLTALLVIGHDGVPNNTTREFTSGVLYPSHN